MKLISSVVRSAPLILVLSVTACGSGRLPAGLDGSSVARTSAVPLSLTTNGLNSLYVSSSLQLFVTGGVSPYVFTVTGGGTVDQVTNVYIAPSSPSSVTITATDQANAQVKVTLTVVAQQPTPSPSPAPTPAPSPAPAPAPTPTLSPSKPIFRFFNAATGLHSFSDVAADSQGGAYEGPAYLVRSGNDPGTVPLYRCEIYAPFEPNRFVDTTSPNCEGTSIIYIYQLGYVYPAQNSSGALLPLFRWSVNYLLNGRLPMSDHLEWTVNQPPAAGWGLDGIIGYVPAN